MKVQKRVQNTFERLDPQKINLTNTSNMLNNKCTRSDTNWKFKKRVQKHFWTFRPPKNQLNQHKQYVKQLMCGNLTYALIWNWLNNYLSHNKINHSR